MILPFLLRERISANLDVMMSDTIEVKVNLMASRKIKQKFNKVQEETPRRCTVIDFSNLK
jgi:hypothetical protein